jgi:hypothetical protein
MVRGTDGWRGVVKEGSAHQHSLPRVREPSELPERRLIIGMQSLPMYTYAVYAMITLAMAMVSLRTNHGWGLLRLSRRGGTGSSELE